MHVTLPDHSFKLAPSGAHELNQERLNDTLAALPADLSKSRRCNSLLVVGDWNIDQKPSFSNSRSRSGALT